jgi:hypothetical protein
MTVEEHLSTFKRNLPRCRPEPDAGREKVAAVRVVNGRSLTGMRQVFRDAEISGRIIKSSPAKT